MTRPECAKCSHLAVWRWVDPETRRPVFLCDADAADKDLSDLRELGAR